MQKFENVNVDEINFLCLLEWCVYELIYFFFVVNQEFFLFNCCIINVDREMDDIFEVMELNKEFCLFKVKKIVLLVF